MDHYCTWVRSTVGLYNHKFFVQFLLYAGFCALFASITCFPDIADIISNEVSKFVAILFVDGEYSMFAYFPSPSPLLLCPFFYCYLEMENRFAIFDYHYLIDCCEFYYGSLVVRLWKFSCLVACGMDHFSFPFLSSAFPVFFLVRNSGVCVLLIVDCVCLRLHFSEI